MRAVLVGLKRDYDKATKDSVRVGILISYGFMAFGFLIMASGSFLSGIWILLIGWFLNSGAQSYLSQYELSSVLSNVRLRDIMNTNIISIKPDLPIDQLLSSHFQIYMKSAFPVVNNENQLLGLVTLKRAMEVPDHRRRDMTAEDVMIPTTDLIVMRGESKADEALLRMTRRVRTGLGGPEEKEERRKQFGKIFICDDNDRLIGLVSKTDILNIESERQEYAQQLRKSSNN